MQILTNNPNSVNIFVTDDDEQGYTVVSPAAVITIPRSLYGLALVAALADQLCAIEQDLHATLVDASSEIVYNSDVQPLNNEVTL